MQRLAVVLEEPGRGIVRIDLTRGWSETLGVARAGRETGLRVYVAEAADVACRWVRGAAPTYVTRHAAMRRSS